MEEHQHTGLENNAHYLHFRYRYGFIANFTSIYTAYMGKHMENETEPTFDKTEAFFQAFIKLMGLEAEFDTRTIDQRTFTLLIEQRDTPEGLIANYECISARQLMSIAPTLIDIIAKPGFKHVRLILGDSSYLLRVLDEA